MFKGDEAMIGIQNNILKKYIGNEEKIIIPEGVEKIASLAFGRPDNQESQCPALKEVILPETITEIAPKAFYRCETLEKINLPGSLKSIGAEAFSYCYQLREIIIPESVTEIGREAFCWCQPEELFIPAHITDLKPDDFGIFQNIGHMTYRNIDFSARKFKGMDVRDCVRLINQHDISVQIPSPEKEYIIFQLYCQYPDDKNLLRFLKDKFTAKFSVLVDRNKPELIAKVLESGKLITKNNISSCLYYAIQHKKPGITLLLTDYKYHHFGLEDIQTVVGRKFAL